MASCRRDIVMFVIYVDLYELKHKPRDGGVRPKGRVVTSSVPAPMALTSSKCLDGGMSLMNLF